MAVVENLPRRGRHERDGREAEPCSLLRIKAVAADRDATAPPTTVIFYRLYQAFFAKKWFFFAVFLQKIAKIALLQILRIMPFFTGKKKESCFLAGLQGKFVLSNIIYYVGINGNKNQTSVWCLCLIIALFLGIVKCQLTFAIICCILILSACRRGGGEHVSIIINFLLSIVAGVIVRIICKLLDI